jgi:hypothetical protein
VLAHPPAFPDLSPCNYSLVAEVKEPLWECQLKFTDVLSKAVTALLHNLSSYNYSASVVCLSHRWEKHVNLGSDCPE